MVDICSCLYIGLYSDGSVASFSSTHHISVNTYGNMDRFVEVWRMTYANLKCSNLNPMIFSGLMLPCSELHHVIVELDDD